jgi:deoxyribonuclease (pyrimidine dimer)
MTRINCVPPQQLCQQHLVAEYRELPRIFQQAWKSYERGETIDDPRNPTQYTLGTGHVRFFYLRLGYLIVRQTIIIAEMQRRGITTNFGPPKRTEFIALPDEWFGDWVPDEEAILINMERIIDRMPTHPIFKIHK